MDLAGALTRQFVGRQAPALDVAILVYFVHFAHGLRLIS
jgi:hypothetical protein